MDNIKLTEQVLTAINTGKTASVIFGHMSPTLKSLAENIVARLKQDYRAGTFDGTKAMAAIAQLVTLEDIENSLRTQMVKGESAFAKTQGEKHEHVR